MRKIITLICPLLFLSFCSFAQASLETDGYCAGATLTVQTAKPVRSIVWLQNDGPAPGIDDTQGTFSIVAGGNQQGDGLNQLNNPTDVFVDQNGYIYVADQDNHRILKFPPNSTPSTLGVIAAGGAGNGHALNQLNRPAGVFVDASGNLFVADTYNNRIMKFPAGSGSSTPGAIVAGADFGFGTQTGLLHYPKSVAVDQLGYIYVSDSENERVIKFPPNSVSLTDGVVVAGGNGAGAAQNQLDHPHGLCVDPSGSVFIADVNNHRVIRFPTGSTSTSLGSVSAGGSGAGVTLNRLNKPADVHFDRNGNIYIADLLNFRIIKFPAGSTPLTNGTVVIGANGPGSGPDQLSAPTGVYVDAQNAIYVADPGAYRVLKWTPRPPQIYKTQAGGYYNAIITYQDGSKDTTGYVAVNLPVDPLAVGLESVGINSAQLDWNSVEKAANYNWKVVLSGAGANAAGVVSGTTVDTFAVANGLLENTDYAFYVRNGCGGGWTGPIPFTTSSNSSKSKPTLTAPNTCLGTELTVKGARRIVQTIWRLNGAALPTPGCALVDSGLEVVNESRGLLKPSNVILDKSGNIFISDFGHNELVRYSAKTLAGSVVAYGLKGPAGLRTDAAGNVYLADAGNNRIIRYPDGKIIAGGNGPGDALNQLTLPTDLFIDPKGQIYVSDAANHRVILFPANSSSDSLGVVVAGGNRQGTALNQLNSPYGIYLDAAGWLYVADEFNQRILKFPPGSTSKTLGIIVAGGNGEGARTNQFSYPTSLYIDKCDNLLVTDVNNNRVLKFPKSATSATFGAVVAGGQGTGPALNQLSGPNGLVGDAAGNLYIADGDNKRVVKYLNNTATLKWVANLPGYYSVVVTYADGTVSTTDSVLVSGEIDAHSLFVNNINNNGAELHWGAAPYGKNYRWKIVVVGAGFKAPALASGVTTDTFAFASGLKDSTYYDFFVQPDCGDPLNWTGRVTFQTLAEATAKIASSSPCLGASVSLQSTRPVSKIIWRLNGKNLPDTTASASFTPKNPGAYSAIVRFSDSSTYITNTLNIGGALPAASLFITDVATNSAKLYWAASGVGAQYRWKIVQAGGGAAAAALFSGETQDTFLIAQSLKQGVHYDFYVQNDCGPSFTGPLTFTTVDLSLVVFPNPTDQYLTVRTPYPWKTMTLYNILGEAVLIIPHPKPGDTSLDLSDLPPGSFILEAKEGDKRALAKVFLVK